MASDDLSCEDKTPDGWPSLNEDPSLASLELKVLADRDRRERCFRPSSEDVQQLPSKAEAETKRNDQIRQFLTQTAAPSERESASPRRRERRHSRSDPLVFRCVTDVRDRPVSITSALTGDRVYCSASTQKRDKDWDIQHTHGHPISSFSVEQVRQQMEEAMLRTPPLPSDDTEMIELKTVERLWVHKYAPQTFSDLITDDRMNREVMKWLKSWKAIPPRRRSLSSSKSANPSKTPAKSTGKKSPSTVKITDFFQPFGQADHPPNQTPLPVKARAPMQVRTDRRVLMLCGPVGVGKTCLIKIAAKMCGYHPFVIDASHDRSAVALQSLLEGALDAQPVFSVKQPNCVIFDEIDTLMPGIEARQSVLKIIEFIQGGAKKKGYLRRPMIFICNTPHVSYLASLRPFAKILYVPHCRVNKALVSRLQMICTNERIEMELPSLHALAEEMRNDISACLNILQFQSRRSTSTSEHKWIQQTPFQIWESILIHSGKDASFMDLLQLFEHFGEYDLILKGILRNYIHVYAQDHRFQKRRRIARWMSNISSIAWRLPDHCPVLFTAIRSVAAASNRRIKIEWPREDFESSRHFKMNNDAIRSFLAELHPNVCIPSAEGRG